MSVRQNVNTVAVTARERLIPNYRQIVAGGLASILPMAKDIAENENKYFKYSGANEQIVWDDNNEQWVYNDTRENVQPISRDDVCNAAIGDANQTKCGDIFMNCLTAKSKSEASNAATKCTMAIKDMGALFFSRMRQDVDRMHPSQAVNFLTNLGFKGERRNGLDGFQTPESWRRNLSSLLVCEKTNDELCAIINNLKLQEYINTVWAHVHNNPQMLNVGHFHGHHNTEKDDCCDVPGYDIRTKKNIPGKIASLKRLAYQIRRQRNLRFAMLGIPHALITTNLVGGGANLLNKLQTYNMTTGADVVNEYLKQIPTASKEMSHALKTILDESRRVGRDLSNDSVVSDMKDELNNISKLERKLRRMTVALAALVDKMSVSGKDVASDNVTAAELEKVWSAAQRYTIKLGRAEERMLSNVEIVAKKFEESGLATTLATRQKQMQEAANRAFEFGKQDGQDQGFEAGVDVGQKETTAQAQKILDEEVRKAQSEVDMERRKNNALRKKAANIISKQQKEIDQLKRQVQRQ